MIMGIQFSFGDLFEPKKRVDTDQQTDLLAVLILVAS